MAGPFPPSEFEFEISTNGSSYTSYAAGAIQVTPGGGERPIGSAHVASRGNPYVTSGKKAASSYSVRVLYLTGGSDLYTIARGYYLNNTKIWLRYGPEGSASGSVRITIGPGYIGALLPPPGDSGSGDPMALEFSFDAEGESDDTYP